MAKGKILVVDDEEDVRDVIKLQLSNGVSMYWKRWTGRTPSIY